MKISELFKRVVGWDEYGRRNAHSLKQDQAFHDKHGLTKLPFWQDMMDDILGCENEHQLNRCALYWSVVYVQWPLDWQKNAEREFDLARGHVEALAALQADTPTRTHHAFDQ